MTTRLTIPRPDDWHLHLRDGAMLAGVLPETARHFARALIMPNLDPPVVTAAHARAYRDRIYAVLPTDMAFDPRMTLYLTETTDPADVAAAAGEGVAHAVKLYPAGATTNSASGVRDVTRVMPVLEKMAEIGLPLCLHGEVTDPAVDIFDREKVFLERVLIPLCDRLPDLKITLEHITTADGVDFVATASGRVAGTITVHHLMITRNDVLVGGIKPHYYCLPVAKRAAHRTALRNAATSGGPRFFLGTDSAPHVDAAKESACGCAGIFSATNALSCLAHVFEAEGALDQLELFVARNGAAHYGVPVAQETLTLEKRAVPVRYPEKIVTKAGDVTVFDPGHPLYWHVTI